MGYRDRVKMLLPAGIIALLLLLAISVNGLQMLPGRPFNLGDPGPMATGGSDLSGDPNNIAIVIFRVMMIAAVIALPFALVMAALTPEARRQLLAYGIMGAMLVLGYLMLRGTAQSPRDLEVAKQALAKETPIAQATRLPTDVFKPGAPDWLVLAISIGIGLLICGIIAAVVFVLWRRSRPANTAMQELATEAQNAMQALQSGAELKDVVMRCYREMSRVLQKERGIQRQAAMTAREFEIALGDKGIPAEPVEQLTRLFEKVRYGHEPLALQDEQLAMSSLSAIVAACNVTHPAGASA